MGQWRYLPDVPPDTPEVYQTCDGWHSDRHGLYRTGWMENDFLSTGGLSIPFSEMKNLPVASLTRNSNIVAIMSSGGSASAYVYNGSTWNDRTGGTSVTGGFQEGICQLGNITVVGTPANGCFSRDATTTNNFAAAAGSANARILFVTDLDILVALSGGSTVGTDNWYTSDFASTDFTVGGSSAAASGNLRQTPGAITAGVPFGKDAIAFKRRGVYRGTFYETGDVIWRWELVRGSEKLGAWGPGCAVNAGGIIYFVGDQGVYKFDGTNFDEVSVGIWDTLNSFLASGVSASDYPFTKMAFDSVTGLITFHSPGLRGPAGRNGNAQEFYSYNTMTSAWGHQSRVTDAGTSAYTAVVEGIETDWFSGAPDPATGIALFNATTNKIVTVSNIYDSVNVGTNYKPKIGTGKIGTRQRITAVTQAVPRWTISDGVGDASPVTGTGLATATVKTVTPYYADSIIESMTQGSDVTLVTDRYWADYRKTAWWHKFEIKVDCNAVIDGIEIVSPKVGKK